jgi:hypothetical protein
MNLSFRKQQGAIVPGYGGWQLENTASFLYMLLGCIKAEQFDVIHPAMIALGTTWYPRTFLLYLLLHEAAMTSIHYHAR